MQTVRTPWVPDIMRVPPRLDPSAIAPPKRPKHALLINPFYPKDGWASLGKHVLTPTLALTSVASSTPADWTVEYWDENLLQGPPPLAPFPQVVGISVHLTFAKRAFELAAWYRQRGAIVVLGGLHVLSCPDECAPHADILAVGEGVQLWGRILDDVAAGTFEARYDGSFLKPYRDDPPPRRDLLKRRAFLTTTSLIATRGCHSRCGFCYLATKGLHMPYQLRDPDQIAAEFAADDQSYGVFTDNNLGSKPDYLLKLCRALKPLNKLWSAAVSIDVTDRPDVVREMALAGCFGVFVGFESLSPDNIAESGKKSPRPDEYARRVRLLHEHGIQVNGSFVLGFDHDGPNVFAETVEWIEANRLECATFHILTPYPGTPLYRQLYDEGRLLHKDWEKYDTAHVVFRPKQLTEEELANGYGWCYGRLFSLKSIWRRRPRDPAAVLPYLAMSLLYKRSNRLWHFLIRHRLTGTVWRPIMQWSRWRHLRFRRKLARASHSTGAIGPSVVSAGV